MFKWKTAEKLAQPKITEVIAEGELNATAIVEQPEPSPMPTSEAPVDAATPAENLKSEPPEAPSIAQPTVPVVPASPTTQRHEPTTVPVAEARTSAISDSSETPPELGERYEVLEFIGSGGMGSVWKVYDKQLDGTFAVKVLKPELLADATAVKRFEKEANLASDLTHANIAAIFGPGTDSQGRPFIIMGYVDGDSLADILACEGKLSEERALDIFTQICEALSHSHMKGIIHRDIKPSNIIISKTESGGDMVHIVDFGIARCIYDEVTKTQALTKAVDILGSPRYMSPEQFLGNNVTGQSDIYSLGCVFYEMLTGAPPFTDENPVKLILQHISETPDISKIPIRFQLLLSLCLAKEPEQRVPSVDRLLERVPSFDSNYSGAAAQPANLTHCMVAVGLILASGLASTIATDSDHTMYPCCSFLLILVWIYVVSVNRDNAGRSVNYKILEFNLFLASIAAVVTDSVALMHIQFLSLLVTPFLAASSLWLIFQPRVVGMYSSCISAISSRIASRHSRLVRRHAKLIDNVGIVVMAALVAFLTLMTSTLVVVPTLVMVCASGFDASVASLVLMPCAAMFVFFNFMVVLIRLLDDVTQGNRTARQSLGLSIKVQSAMAVAVVLITTVATSTVGRSGFNQFFRQCYPCRAVGQKQELLRLEALSYPDSLLANQAKLIAASHLYGRYKRNSDALTLCNKIIESKREKDPVTLASAYALRARILGLKVQGANVKADLEKSLSLLEGSQQPSFSDLELNIARLLQPYLVENEALSIVDLAVKNTDSVLSRRALDLAKKYGKNDHSYREQYRKELQAKIEALSASKLLHSTDRK